MKFDLNETQYMVKFKRNGIFTYAELWQYKDEISDWDCLNILAIAECSKKDVFTKSTGRKTALAKLLKLMNKFNVPELTSSKEQRLTIWKVYFETHKKD